MLVTRTEPSPTGLRRSCGGDAEPALSLFQGPGESPDIRGLGSGVTSPMADIIGLGTKLLVPLAVPILLAKACLRLGVLEMGRKLLAEARWFSVREPREDELPLPLKDSRLEGVEGKAGKSVEIRSDPRGLWERLAAGEEKSGVKAAS